LVRRDKPHALFFELRISHAHPSSIRLNAGSAVAIGNQRGS
jgi:hypothetical protein